MTDPNPASPSLPQVSTREGGARRCLLVGACYVTGALIGAWVGREYYLPNPFTVGEHLLLADLRHGGAIVGAMSGALASALLTPRLAGLRSGLLSAVVVAIGGVLLGYLLLESALLLGLATLFVLTLPWCCTLLVRSRRPS
jgi:hypothetical protein